MIATQVPVVSRKVREFYVNGSAIRRMFVEGLRLKELHGEGAVADVSIGNPCFEPPAAFRKALREAAADRSLHGYMPNAGYPDVCARVAEHLRSRGYFSEIEGRHVVMTTGAAGALNVALKAILEPGDEVIVPNPHFVEYRFYIDNHGGRMVLADTHDDFSLNVNAVADAVTERTRAVILNSPNNPTGRVYRRPSLESLAEMLRVKAARWGRPLFLLSDEPYRELLFSGHEHASPASLYENSFMCYSWSKAFSIAGERIGYLAVNPMLRTADWSVLMGSLAMCNRFLGFVNAPALMQRAIAASIDAGVDVAHYAAKRERLCRALDAGGYDYAEPEGTFYIFPKTIGTEEEFLRRAREKLLLVVPGSAFGRKDHFRISFAASDATVNLACKKLIELGRR